MFVKSLNSVKLAIAVEVKCQLSNRGKNNQWENSPVCHLPHVAEDAGMLVANTRAFQRAQGKLHSKDSRKMNINFCSGIMHFKCILTVVANNCHNNHSTCSKTGTPVSTSKSLQRSKIAKVASTYLGQQDSTYHISPDMNLKRRFLAHPVCDCMVIFGLESYGLAGLQHLDILTQ